jgi:DNA-binding NtrC family response regulator
LPEKPKKRQRQVLRPRRAAHAGRLGLHRSNLYRKMRQLGMNASDDEG